MGRPLFGNPLILIWKRHLILIWQYALPFMAGLGDGLPRLPRRIARLDAIEGN